jgi:hypothetical protein
MSLRCCVVILIACTTTTRGFVANLAHQPKIYLAQKPRHLVHVDHKIAHLPNDLQRPLRAPSPVAVDTSEAIPAAVSLVAGMLGGAIGVGVAYPLDTLKTKTQSGAGSGPSNPFVLARNILRDEGVPGFYGGVSSTMAGQAIIKGVLFLQYNAARNALARANIVGTLSLILAAASSGAVGSLVITPVERVKCVMQAMPAGSFKGPLACIRELLRRDGASGLLFRGLGATLLRELPACTFYFVTFDLTKALLLGSGALSRTSALLISGAFAGAMSWVPVYPIDVVKTQIQIELDEGSEGESGFLGQARRLWQAGGFWAFWDGLGPKLARAIVNHAVTFFVFDFVCRAWMRLLI